MLTHALVEALCCLQLLAEAADVCAHRLLLLLPAARLLAGAPDLRPQPLGLLGRRARGLLGQLEVDLGLPQQLVSLLDGLPTKATSGGPMKQQLDELRGFASLSFLSLACDYTV